MILFKIEEEERTKKTIKMLEIDKGNRYMGNRIEIEIWGRDIGKLFFRKRSSHHFTSNIKRIQAN